MARQQLLIRDLGSDLEAARRQSRQQAGADAQQANAAEARTRQLLLQLEEATAREAAWRRHTNEQAAMAAKAAARLRQVHGEEVAVLTEKLRQMQREVAEGQQERIHLQREAGRREADLAVLSQEVLRLRGGQRGTAGQPRAAGSPSRQLHL